MCDHSMATLANMPDEIVLRIAYALGQALDVVRLGSTCSHYNRLLRDNHLWKFLCLKWFGPPLHEGFLDAGKSWQWLYRAQGSVASTTGADVGALMTPGRIYWGDSVDGRPHGYGLSIALPTKHRDGRALTRRRHDSDLDDAAPHHDGYWAHGRACGYGVRVYRNGSRYRGMWRNDLHHGYGERADEQGWVYGGEWHDGHPHGEGPCDNSSSVNTFPGCGIHYGRSDLYYPVAQGHGDNGTMTLSAPSHPVAPTTRCPLWDRTNCDAAARQNPWPYGGTLFLPDGVVYMRARYGDVIRGTVTWPDGKQFEGRWTGWHVYREFTADGIMTYPNGRVDEGAFWNGRLRGSGMVTYPNGVCVAATWCEGQTYGVANVSWPDGRRYVGSWRDDACNGHGEMTWPDGSHWAGTWVDGQPVTASEIVPAAMAQVAAPQP